MPRSETKLNQGTQQEADGQVYIVPLSFQVPRSNEEGPSGKWHTWFCSIKDEKSSIRENKFVIMI
jgi:hypothetical protein